MIPQGPDEAMLRDGKHVAHTSGGREGFGATLIVLCLGAMLGTQLSWGGTYLYVAVLLAVSLTCGVAVGRWIGGMNARAAAKLEAEYREEREKEVQRQLAEMRRTVDSVTKTN